jgi:uncharacterized protein (TIGR02646 family)
MVHRDLDPILNSPWFPKWKAEADAMRDAFIREYTSAGAAVPPRQPAFDFDKTAPIWRRLKPYLIELFKHKCAYCEFKFEANEVGEVEHYRPKARVAGAPEHPGYFWLAFELENLLISCSNCNKWGGKKNQFPLADSADRAMLFCPNHELDNEQPLLLNPYTDLPEQHLHFDPEIGTVESLTERGAATIRVCDLNREPLAEKRKEAQQSCLNTLMLLWIKEKYTEARSLREEIRSGDVEFAAAVRAELEARFEKMGVADLVSA